MWRWFVPMAVLLVLSPSLSTGETREDFRQGKGTSEKSKLIPRGGPKLIPKDVIVEQLKKRGEVTFHSDSILFHYGLPKIKAESYPQLAEIAAALRQAFSDPELSRIRKYFVDGHCCNIGSAANNCRLSWARAHSVISQLKSLGVPGNRLVPRGYGFFYPAYPNDTESTRRLNRRVVLKGYPPGRESNDPPIPCPFDPDNGRNRRGAESE